MKTRYTRITVGLLAGGVIALITVLMPVARADEPVKSGISPEASAAVRQMGKTLSANDFSFQAKTIRVYQDDDDQPLHIFHAMNVIVHRPDKLAVSGTFRPVHPPAWRGADLF